jgi:monomeric isocitrate dehydrogenase
MNIILSIILIALFIFGLQWSLQHILSKVKVEKFERHFEKLEQNFLAQLENIKTMIRVLYKFSNTTIDVDLSEKGLKQLEFIYQDARNAISNKHVGTDSKLFLLKTHEDVMREFNDLYSNIDLVKSTTNSLNNYENGRIYNNIIDEYKEEVLERLDIILNGNLSTYYKEYNASNYETEEDGKLT